MRDWRQNSNADGTFDVPIEDDCQHLLSIRAAYEETQAVALLRHFAPYYSIGIMVAQHPVGLRSARSCVLTRMPCTKTDALGLLTRDRL